ncbi:MAG: trigger factor [Oscillospiraceae bacterium]|nr:trigger factor [Oscillospiraceae bacterium]MBR4656758.1 trigger factor [Oscillospiraceae bacterium]
MTIKSANRENNKLTVQVEVEKEVFETGIQKAYLKNRKYIAVPGFRKGKAPRKMIENLYGPQVFHSDAVEEIFPEVFKEAVTDQGWKPVGQPSVTDMNVREDKTLELTIEVELYPEVELGQYKGVEAPKAAVVVTDEEVEAELDKKANEVARIVTVERPAQEGDTVVIDYKGLKDGVPFDGGSAEGYELRLGSHSFIPGFEEQLIGAAAGEEKALNLSFPEDYHAKELAGAAVVFEVKVHEVKETQVPAKDDELAKDVSEFDTLEELKEDLRKQIETRKEEEASRAFESALMEKIAEGAKLELPAAMIEEEVDTELQNFDYQLRAQGMSLEQYSKMMGGDLSRFRASIRPSAEKQVRLRTVLKAIAEAEKLEAAEEDLNAEYQKLSEQYSMDEEKLKTIIPVEEITTDIKVRKARDLVIAEAVATAPVEE